MTAREIRRLVGVLRARLPEAQFKRVSDPRRQASVQRPLWRLLTACLVGMVCGANSVADVEALTVDMAAAARRALGLGGRVPDTTLRDLLVRLDPFEIVQGLHRMVRAALRRKAIAHDGLPFGAVSLDGKGTAIDAWDPTFAQQQPHSSGTGAHGLLRTVTSCLISSPARPCVDAYPVPADTNEMGAYKDALDHLLRAYLRQDLFRLVLYDAGACSEANARYTRSKGLHYVFCLNEQQPTLYAEAQRVLSSKSLEQADHVSEHPRGGGVWRRYLFVTEELAGWLDWDHLRTVVRVVSERVDGSGCLVSVEQRYYVSSLPQCRLQPAQWNLLIRRRWAVENECHHTWDTVFEEDEHPWIESDPRGALVVMMMRRLAYTLMALYRSVTLRSEENRRMPWRTLVRRFFVALVAATEQAVADLRPRRFNEALCA